MPGKILTFVGAASILTFFSLNPSSWETLTTVPRPANSNEAIKAAQKVVMNSEVDNGMYSALPINVEQETKWQGNAVRPMATYDDDWALDEQVCPADIHFIEWLQEKNIHQKTIFHFGTGGHHKIGSWIHENTDNTVLGITASPKEFQHFVELSTKDVTLTHRYQVYFGDIYLLNPTLLPKIDVANLFHLAEFRSTLHDEYGGMTDKQVVEMFLKLLPKDGFLITYTGSFAYGTAQIYLDELVSEG